MTKKIRSIAALSLGGALAALLTATASAVPVHTDNTNVSSWDVGIGQSNGNFSVTSDAAFNALGIQLGLRAERRRVGAVTPTGENYTVQAGADPSQSTRAWWNFQFSTGYNASILSLDSLVLGIRKDGGSNASPTGTGLFDLLALRAFIDDRNLPKSDTSFSDIYQGSQNPVFAPWFSGYSLGPTQTFAYRFTLGATKGGEFASTSMCVHTSGLACSAAPVFGPAAVPEPESLALLGLGLAAMGFGRLRRKSA